MSIRRIPVALAAAVLLVAAGPAWAQQVRGRLLGAVSSQPLSGGYVTLLDPRDRAVATTITDRAGWFELRAPGAGTYRVRAEYIGHETVEEKVDVPVDGVTWIELRAAFRAIELEGLTAEVEQACDVPAEAARRVAMLWSEVRKSFQVTAYLEAEGLYLFEVDRWTRTLDPRRLAVTEEVRRPRRGFHPGSPFVSLPPEQLAARGYVQQPADGEALSYYAPDARVLLHRSFQDTHCFGFSPEGPEDGWVGLRFRPRDERAADIEGTLWIDETTYEPLRLDYRYPVLPWPLVTDEVGGRLEFARIEEGPWIVKSWRIRMPVVQERTYAFARGAQRRYTLAALVEEGGTVRDARAGENAVLSTDLGVVEGVVRDSVAGTPLQGVRVRLRGTFLEAQSDASGRFRIPDVPEGRYDIVAEAELLTLVGAPEPTTQLDVEAGRATHLEVLVPSAYVAASAGCDQPLTESGAGVLAGTVADSAGHAVPGAEVEVMWQTVASGLHDVIRGEGIERRVHRATVPVRPDGSWVACGAPFDEQLSVRGMAPGYRGPPVTIRLAEGRVTSVALDLAPERLVAVLVVRVFGRGEATPLQGAEVSFPELGRSALSDESGTAVLRDVPAESLVIRTQHLAYLPRIDTLQVPEEDQATVRIILEDRAIELEPLVVEVLAPEAELNRVSGSSAGIRLSRADIREAYSNARANNVAEVLRDALPNGVRISPIVRGSNYVGTCIESTRGGYARRKTPGVCSMVQVVVDGGYLTTDEAARLVESFPLSEIVSMELLSPMEQTFRYGTGGGTGMLIIRTARGPGRRF